MHTIEHTDTFGGDANYSWVRRWHTSRDLSDLALVRLAKRLCGLSGHRCRVDNMGDCIALYPRGICQVIFISWAEDEYTEQFGRDAFPDDLSPSALRAAGLHPSQTK